MIYYNSTISTLECEVGATIEILKKKKVNTNY